MFQHAFKAVRDGEFDICFRAEVIQCGAFEKINFCTKNFKVFGPDIRADVYAGGTFADIGFDKFLSLFAGDRNPMMPVYYEVDLAYFIEDDGWKVNILIKGAVNFLPAAGELVILRKKGTIEFVITIETACDLIDTDGFYAALNGTADV